MLDKKARLKAKRDLGAGNYLLTFASPEQARLVHPGQFVMLKCAYGIDEAPLLRRPLSVFDIHRHPRTERPAGIDLLVKDVGPGTHRLVELACGSEVYILGPQGRHFQVSGDMRNNIGAACLVAGGVGIAPLYLLARALIAQDAKPILFYGGRSAADLVLRDYFERPRKNLRIYACGPWGMMKATHEVAARYQVPCEVSLESRMACSLGACMGCVVHGRGESGEERYLRVCLEGPIMNSRSVDWDSLPL
jgi:dihydroorotate dehydrogenase electron transfer subunit